MTNKRKSFLILFVCVTIISIFNSCNKEEEATGTDKELYDMAKEMNGFTWFNNSDALLNKSSGSGHPQDFLRTRYNDIAATQLDASGRVLSAASFPEGSLIVKELYENSSTLSRYAILYKNSNSSDADSRGWVWGYINADGTVAEAAANRGTSCIACHSQADNIDYMLMNKYFP